MHIDNAMRTKLAHIEDKPDPVVDESACAMWPSPIPVMSPCQTFRPYIGPCPILFGLVWDNWRGPFSLLLSCQLVVSIRCIIEYFWSSTNRSVSYICSRFFAVLLICTTKYEGKKKFKITYMLLRNIIEYRNFEFTHIFCATRQQLQYALCSHYIYFEL